MRPSFSTLALIWCYCPSFYLGCSNKRIVISCHVLICISLMANDGPLLMCYVSSICSFQWKVSLCLKPFSNWVWGSVPSVLGVSVPSVLGVLYDVSRGALHQICGLQLFPPLNRALHKAKLFLLTKSSWPFVLPGPCFCCHVYALGNEDFLLCCPSELYKFMLLSSCYYSELMMAEEEMQWLQLPFT